ncbi:DUF6134 family protein [Fibrella forsythiae]|uniref:Uncharacterized protein n=1 Tax=Fibrella forsythiae TaxID=2817061 RepID=A0ABS3JN70_9BACT|nr:DUF6134 family protein [Fibrella forsythiae]MBO0951461.1 hypothetical protein [Fibrella forsythiae]
MRYVYFLLSLLVSCGWATAQSTPETHHYAIDIAGARIGTMTASRQQLPNNEVVYTQISDVQVNFLVYKLTIYYKVISRLKNGQLMLATVEAHTNKGNYSSRTEWVGTHYEINANQYKYERKATENRKIDFTISMMYFSEPSGRQRVYAEYFGDYFTLTPSPRPGYQAILADREDEYIYEKGRLVRVIKKNALKNFNIRLLD